MDITPIIAEGKQVIDGYGDAGFTVTGLRHEGSILLFPDDVSRWLVTDFSQITAESLAPLIARATEIDVLLIGCGKRLQFLDEPLEQLMLQHQIVVDVMDTGAACRTYNVLLSEERNVAAALIAV